MTKKKLVIKHEETPKRKFFHNVDDKRTDIVEDAPIITITSKKNVRAKK